MKTLTIQQPWATLIALKAKRYETRSWFTHYRGPLAIHASKEFNMQARRLCRSEPFASALLGNVDLPTGCIIAVCELTAIFPTSPKKDELPIRLPDEEFSKSEMAFGDFSPGRFAWYLTNVRAFEHPIPARGAQGLWEWNEQLITI